MEFLSTFADIIFGWILDANESSYAIMNNCDVPAWVLLALFIVTFSAVYIFYYEVSKNAANATNRNYIVVFLLGLLVLWLVNLILVPTIVGDFDYAFEMNNIMLSLIDSLYYAILYEIISLLIKDKSNGRHIHLLNCWK